MCRNLAWVTLLIEVLDEIKFTALCAITVNYRKDETGEVEMSRP